MKRIYFTVTNDLTYDQRMHRICTTLAENGYDVTLVGRKLDTSKPLPAKKFQQKRIRCVFTRSKWFYAEYNIRLFFYLLLKKMDAICAIDLDTILACYRISKLKNITRIYDAHELFTEMKEVITRPRIHRSWLNIEKKMVPRFPMGYTVSDGIAAEFKNRYGVNYQTIRNVPFLKPLNEKTNTNKFILYQGAVNEARGLEWLVPAMKWVKEKLVICGDGNFMAKLEKLIADHQLENKIELRGLMTPEALEVFSQQAYIGVALPEKEGLNQLLALPNKFFDYIHAGIPQLTVKYPEYEKVNQQFEVAVLLDDLRPERIAEELNNLLDNTVLYNRLRQNCLEARNYFNWQTEEQRLISFYRSVLTSD